MNRSRKAVFFRIMATIMCAACVVVMCSGYQARAETTADFPVVSSRSQFLQAFVEANDGDTIGISDIIAFYGDSAELGSEDKRITIVRMNEEAHLSCTGAGSFLIQNIVFDGNGIESMYSMFYSQRDLVVKNSADTSFLIIEFLGDVLTEGILISCGLYISLPAVFRKENGTWISECLKW